MLKELVASIALNPMFRVVSGPQADITFAIYQLFTKAEYPITVTAEFL